MTGRIQRYYPYSGEQPNIQLWRDHEILNDDDKEWMLENVHLYTLREMAAYLNCSVSVIFRYLKEKGVSRKKQKLFRHDYKSI